MDPCICGSEESVCFAASFLMAFNCKLMWNYVSLNLLVKSAKRGAKVLNLL